MMNNLQNNMIFVRDGMFMGLKKIVYTEDNSIVFDITFQLENVMYHAQVAAQDIYRKKFLRHIPLGDIDEQEFYDQIRKLITQYRFAEMDVRFITNRNGLQMVNGRWMFVFSNGSVCKNGFDEKICSGEAGYYIPPEAVLDVGEVKGVIKNLFGVCNRNPKVFYPLLLFNLMAITNGYFRVIGEKSFMKLTLWVAGASGSGKTELATAIGTYVFADKSLNSNAVSATARRSYVLENLRHSSGSVFFFDDVKCEPTRERSNSVLGKIDDILRSIFMGKLVDVTAKQSTPPLIDSCALITGEYMKTEESQNARLLYLNVDGFLKDEKNSEALRILQDNPLWLTAVCCDFMSWFLTKMEAKSFSSFLNEKLRELRGGKKRYGGIGNSQRLNENRIMVDLAYTLLEMYLRQKELTEEFIGRCRRAAESSIESLCSSTFALLGGEEMIIQKAVCDLVKSCNIRKARYQNNPYYMDKGCRYRQDYFMLQEDDDILFIEDYEESLETNANGQHDQYVGKPYAIIREEKLMNLMNESVKNILCEYPVSGISADEVLSRLPRTLKKMQLIYKQHRSDGEWGRTAIKYPTCEIKEEWSGMYRGEEKKMEIRCIVTYKPVVQLNIDHSYLEFLMERIEDAECEKILCDVHKVCDVNRKEVGEAEIYKIRKAFMSGKTLYKE